MEKFQVESVLFQDLSDEDRILYSEEICDYLSKDVIKRAARMILCQVVNTYWNYFAPNSFF